jgi:tetratricopeptide (TPR) repeat protein
LAQIHKEHPPHPPHTPAAVPPASRYAPIEVIEVGEEVSPFGMGDNDALNDQALRNVAPNAPPPVFAAPSPAPTLSSLAAELDAELGEGFTPIAQPRREAPVAARPETFIPPPPLPPPVAAPPQSYSPAPQPPRHTPVPAASADLLDLLPAEEETPATPSVFGDLLQEFERDLAAPQQEDDDPETHFNLGIAFREMGLLDEAIGELQKVCRMAGHGLPAERAQQAYIWLATCFVEKSVPEASFKWFQRALEAAPDEDSRTAVNYELASAYEAAGHKREALAHFMEVYGTNIDYRDVADRIRELRARV